MRRISHLEKEKRQRGMILRGLFSSKYLGAINFLESIQRFTLVFIEIPQVSDVINFRISKSARKLDWTPEL